METALCPQLDRAVAELGDLDLDRLSGPALHELVIAVAAARDALAVAHARLIGRWTATGQWADDGSRTAAARLGRDTHHSVAGAVTETRRARQAVAMPATCQAIASGRLSIEHLDLLGRARGGGRADLFSRDEQLLVQICADLRYRPAQVAVDRWIQHADEHAAATDFDRQVDRSGVHVSTTLDHAVIIDGRLDAIRGAAVRDELDRLARKIQLADQRGGVLRTPAQRRAAALYEMAARSAAGKGGSRKPLFTALVGVGTMERLCELADGTVVPADSLVPYFGVADLETVLFDGPNTILTVSRARTFRGAVRRAIEVRDRWCQHPCGCDEPAAHCDVDHIDPYGRGGVTAQSTGRLACPTHNRRADKRIPPDRPAVIHVDFTSLWTARQQFRADYHRRHAPPADDDNHRSGAA